MSDARLVADRALSLLPGALIIYLAFQSGGFFPDTTGFVVIVVLLVILVRTALAERPFEGFGPLVLVATGAMALFAGWTLLSGQWSHAPARALLEFDRVLLYLVVLACFGSVARTPARTAWMLRGVAAGAFAVCLCSLITRALPNLWPVAPNIANERLSYPVSYWNALGLLASLGILACLHLASDLRERLSGRVLATMAIPVLASTLFFTFSRGGILAGAIGLVAYLVLGRTRGLPSALIASVPSTAIALKTDYDANLLATPDPTTHAAVAQGHHVALVVAVCVVLAGILRLVCLPLDTAIRDWHLPVNVRGRVLGTAGATGLVAALALIFALHVPHAVAHQYDRFVHGTNLPNYSNDLRQRLTDPGNNGRILHWRVAWHGFQGSEFHGQGAGTYAVLWARKRPTQLKVLNAHSLYLEVLDELGVVGMVLLGVSLVVMLAGSLTRARGPQRGVYAAIFAIGVAWAVHAGVDWDWQMPVITLPVLALGAAALARAPGEADRGVGRRIQSRLGGPASLTRVGLGLVVIALGILPALIQLSEGDLKTSLTALQNGNCPGAIGAARQSLSWVGSRPEPWEVIGYCRADQGQFAAAEQAMSQAISRDPANWEPRYGLFLVTAAAGQSPLPALRQAQTLDPREQLLITAGHRFAHVVTAKGLKAQVQNFPTSIQEVDYPPLTPLA